MRNIASADLLLIQSLSTETLSFFSGGGGILRGDKLEALSDWPPAYDALHTCLNNPLWEPNCSDCYKDALTMVELYALGKLERFSRVFAVDCFEKTLDQKLGVLLFSKHSLLCADALKRYEDRGFVISGRARAYAAYFARRAAMKMSGEEGETDET